MPLLRLMWGEQNWYLVLELEISTANADTFEYNYTG